MRWQLLINCHLEPPLSGHLLISVRYAHYSFKSIVDHLLSHPSVPIFAFTLYLPSLLLLRLVHYGYRSSRIFLPSIKQGAIILHLYHFEPSQVGLIRVLFQLPNQFEPCRIVLSPHLKPLLDDIHFDSRLPEDVNHPVSESWACHLEVWEGLGILRTHWWHERRFHVRERQHYWSQRNIRAGRSHHWWERFRRRNLYWIFHTLRC